jgi:hypothetical protein
VLGVQGLWVLGLHDEVQKIRGFSLGMGYANNE